MPEISARAAVDNMELMRVNLFKSLLGVKFVSALNNAGDQYGLTYVDDKVTDYNGAYLAYEFNFEMTSQIDSNDICNEDDSVAWRTFTMSMVDVDTAAVNKIVAGKLP